MFFVRSVPAWHQCQPVLFFLFAMNCEVGQCLAGGGGFNCNCQRRSPDLDCIFIFRDLSVIVFGILKSGCQRQFPGVDYYNGKFRVNEPEFLRTSDSIIEEQNSCVFKRFQVMVLPMHRPKALRQLCVPNGFAA